MQICTSPQTDNHASIPPLSFFTGRMPFLLPNQQRQSTEGTYYSLTVGNSDNWPCPPTVAHCNSQCVAFKGLMQIAQEIDRVATFQKDNIPSLYQIFCTNTHVNISENLSSDFTDIWFRTISSITWYNWSIKTKVDPNNQTSKVGKKLRTTTVRCIKY